MLKLQVEVEEIYPSNLKKRKSLKTDKNVFTVLLSLDDQRNQQLINE